jgi:hypothetical protein
LALGFRVDNEKKLEFDGDLWLFKSLEDYIAYKNLSEYINNPDAIKCHIESFDYVLLGSSGGLPEDVEDLHREHKEQDLTKVMNHFCNLTIVGLCTTYEAAIKDFLLCFFFYNPSHIYSFIGTNDLQGIVSLKEILKSKSHEDLIFNLAENAASKASKGKYGDILNRISKLCNEEKCKKISGQLNELQAERNKIIHNKYSKERELQEIASKQEIVSTAITIMCGYGVLKKIPGCYSCINRDRKLVLESFSGLCK